jgi:ABC-2 family transporter protein
MKFLAMLKDSLRETLDVKLFHVLAVISAFVVLGVFSITYKPLPMEPQVKSVTERFTPEGWLFQLYGHLAQSEESSKVAPETTIKDFERTDTRDPDKPWLGDYQFTVSIRLMVMKEGGGFGRRPKVDEQPQPEELAKDLKKIDAAKARLSPEFMSQLCKTQFDFLEGVEVAPGKPSDQPNVIDYTVTTHGCKIKTAKGWYYQPYLFFGLLEVPRPVIGLLAFFFNGFDPDSLKTLGDMVIFFGDRIVGSIGALITMFLSIIVTAAFIPNMLAKGSVDLLLVKPIHRTTLFLYKFVGGLLFMFLLTAFIMAGIWLALGVQTGLWAHSLLLCVPILFDLRAHRRLDAQHRLIHSRSVHLVGMALFPWLDALRLHRLSQDPTSTSQLYESLAVSQLRRSQCRHAALQRHRLADDALDPNRA